MYSILSSLFFFITQVLWLSYVNALSEIPKEHEFMLKYDPYRTLGVGAACMDLLIPVSDEFITQISGEKGGAFAIEIDQFNQIIHESGSIPHIVTGGSCANTIKGLASLGEKCGFLSHVGTDPLGNHFTQYMKKLGIVGLFSKSYHPTARVLCLITPDGQRTMRFCEGCSKEMSDYFLHPDYFRNVKLVHIDSYSLRNGNLVERVMQLAQEANAIISIDLSSFEIVRNYHKTLLKLLSQYVDIVFANEDETKALTGLSPMKGCLKMQEMCPISVVLMGKEGCLVGHQGTVFHSSAFPTQVLDSTGAGDLFASGFIYGLLNHYSLQECAVLGNRLGSAIVTVQGAELPEEQWKMIHSHLQKN